jgi:hypothetical protein
MNADGAWKIISEGFDDLDCYPRIIIGINELRSHLWKKNRIDRNTFQEMLNLLYQSEFQNKIRLFGGPKYTYGKRPNWAEYGSGRGCRGYLIEIETKKHAEYMMGHR